MPYPNGYRSAEPTNIATLEIHVQEFSQLSGNGLLQCLSSSAGHVLEAWPSNSLAGGYICPAGYRRHRTLIAARSDRVGQPVIVDNRRERRNIGAEFAAKGSPALHVVDGHQFARDQPHAVRESLTIGADLPVSWSFFPCSCWSSSGPYARQQPENHQFVKDNNANRN
jgi:hypothetical protein